MDVIFTPDQEMELLTWLESLLERGCSLQEVVDGLRNGSLTTSVNYIPKMDTELFYGSE